MRNGRIVRTAPTSEETTNTLVEAMLGQTLSEMYPPRVLPSADAPYALEVRDLQSNVFEGIDLNVRSGEIVGLAGLVGSGRSRLMRTIFGAEETHGGEILINGTPVHIQHTSDAIRAGVFMLPESRKEQGLSLKQEIRSNLTLPHLESVSWKAGILNHQEETRRIRSLLSDLNVQPPLPQLQVNRLSGGNQQRVLFGKWLFERPSIFLVDEPTRGVDIGAKQAVFRLIAQLAEEGVAILLVSSEMDEILGLSHRVYVMRLGRDRRRIRRSPAPANFPKRDHDGRFRHRPGNRCPESIVRKACPSMKSKSLSLTDRLSQLDRRSIDQFPARLRHRHRFPGVFLPPGL